MQWKPVLKPEGSIVAGIAVMGIVYAVYSHALPSQAEIHATDPHDKNVESGRKKAIITSAAIIGGISLVAKDTRIFILGSFTAVALDFQARHANAVSPSTGQLVAFGSSDSSMSTGQVTQLNAVA